MKSLEEDGNKDFIELTPEQINLYIEERNKARSELNFVEADRIRNFLKLKGIILTDEKGGRGKGYEVTSWKFSNTKKK